MRKVVSSRISPAGKSAKGAPMATLTVQKFGGVCNGVTDDDAAHVALSNAVRPRQRIRVVGTSLGGGFNIYNKDGITIEGTGTIKQRDGSAILHEFTDGKDWVIIGPTFDCRSQASGVTALDIQRMKRFIMEHCTIKNVGDGSVTAVQAVYVAPGCDNTSIQRNYFENIQSGGDLANNGSSHGVMVSNYRDGTKLSSKVAVNYNTFKTLTSIGAVDNSNAIFIDQNTKNSHIAIVGNLGRGIKKRIAKCTTNYAVVADNIVYRDNIAGSFVAMSMYGDYGYFRRNQALCTGDSRYDSLVDFVGSNIDIDDNTLTNAAGADISNVYGVYSYTTVPSNINVRRNSITRAKYHMRFAVGGSDINIEDNVLNGATSHNILFGNTISNVSVLHNTADATPHNFIYLPDAWTNLTANDNVSHAGGGMLSSNPKAGDQIHGNVNNGTAVAEYPQ